MLVATAGCSGPRRTAAASSSSGSPTGRRSRSTWRTASTSARSATGRTSLTLQIFNVGAERPRDQQRSAADGLDRLRGAALAGHAARARRRARRSTSRSVHADDARRAEMATIRIVSNDPGAPVVDLAGHRARAVSRRWSLAVADGGELRRRVPRLVRRSRPGDLNNRGPCPLEIKRITSSSADFVPPASSFFPLVVGAGDSIALPIRFQPSALGSATATITVISNDPREPAQVDVTGNTPSPSAGPRRSPTRGDFGHVCVGDFRRPAADAEQQRQLPADDRPDRLVRSRLPRCPTSTPSRSSSPPVTPPTSRSASSRPASARRSATITITSDDPASPATSRSRASPRRQARHHRQRPLRPGGPRRRAERTIDLTTSVKCDLHVTNVGIPPDPWKPGCLDCDGCGAADVGCGCGTDHARKRIIASAMTPRTTATPPTVIATACTVLWPVHDRQQSVPGDGAHPGASLPVLIRFTATCSGPKCCELLILTDDPDAPSSTVYVTGSLHRTLRSALKCWAADELQDLLRAGTRSG